MPGYCILITVSFQSLVHSAFLAFLTYKLFNKTPLAITYSSADVLPCAAYPTYPTAPIKQDESEYVL